MTTVVILQPGYMPWLGYFDQVRRADVFVHYDDVQFDKHGWRNRNRVKTPEGPAWLTVPVRLGGRGPQLIHDVEIDNRTPWARKHVGTIRHLYARAPFLGECLPPIAELIEARWERLVDLDLALADLLCAMLGVRTTFVRASTLGISGGQTTRLVEICRHFAATRYLAATAARAYLEVERFGDAGIEVEFQDYRHPVYPQLHGAFVPYLSAVDLLLNCGPRSGEVIPGSGSLELASTSSEVGLAER
jgi:hypothetical protein